MTFIKHDSASPRETLIDNYQPEAAAVKATATATAPTAKPTSHQRPHNSIRDVGLSSKIHHTLHKGWCFITGKPLEHNRNEATASIERRTRPPSTVQLLTNNRILKLRGEGSSTEDTRAKLIPLPTRQPLPQYDRFRREEAAILDEVYRRIHPKNHDSLPFDHPKARVEHSENQALMDIMIRKVKAERAAFADLSQKFGTLNVLQFNTAVVDEFNRLLISAEKNPEIHNNIAIDVGHYLMTSLANALMHIIIPHTPHTPHQNEPNQTCLNMLDASLEDLLTPTTKRSLHQAIERFNTSENNHNSSLRRLHLATWEPHANEAFSTLRDGRFKDTPFESIAPHQRWRMCIDPVKINYMRNLHQTSTCKSDDHNELNGFLFELKENFVNKTRIEKGYLNKMAKGWLLVMEGTSQVDADFVLALNTTCYGRSTQTEELLPQNDDHEMTRSFQLMDDYSLSKAGAIELDHFCAEVKALHDININLSALMSASGSNVRASILTRYRHGQSLKPIMEKWINEYHNNCKSADTADQKISAAIVLCQQLARLHPFQGGNCRTTAILLLNRLLMDMKEPLTMLEDPRKLAGLSTSEVLPLIREGQARVKQWASAT